MTARDRSLEVLGMLAENPGLGTQKILDAIGGATQRDVIRRLEREGRIVNRGFTNGARWYLADTGKVGVDVEATARGMARQVVDLVEGLADSRNANDGPKTIPCPGPAEEKEQLAPRSKSGLIVKPPRGPSVNPYIPVGHELAGASTLTGSDGELKEQWNKTRVAGADPTPLPEGFDLPESISRMTRGDGSVVVEWQRYDRKEAERSQVMLDVIRAHVEEHVRPLPPIQCPTACDAEMMTLYPLGDPHIGMLAWAEETGENFDVEIAVRELTACVTDLVTRAPASKRAIIANLGDFFHAQDDKQLTPASGNKLDVDGRFARTARVGLDLLDGLVERVLQKHEQVELFIVPGNHDTSACFWIAETIRREFKNEPRVTLHPAFNPYQYAQFGKCMFLFTHTDGAKLEQLSEIAAADQPVMWGNTLFRYAHGGHIHSRKMIERPGMIGESHRTLAGKDAWTNWRGYRSGRSLQAITYHRQWGEDSRVTSGIERVRALVENRRAA